MTTPTPAPIAGLSEDELGDEVARLRKSGPYWWRRRCHICGTQTTKHDMFCSARGLPDAADMGYTSHAETIAAMERRAMWVEAERDAATRERDALRAEVERLSTELARMNGAASRCGAMLDFEIAQKNRIAAATRTACAEELDAILAALGDLLHAVDSAESQWLRHTEAFSAAQAVFDAAVERKASTPTPGAAEG